MLIDTHLHLDGSDEKIKKIVDRALENDVKYLIVSGSDREDNKFNTKFLIFL